MEVHMDDLETRTAKEIVTALEIASPDPVKLRQAKIKTIANLLKSSAQLEKRLSKVEKCLRHSGMDIDRMAELIDAGKF
jgi:hypothetical protein